MDLNRIIEKAAKIGKDRFVLILIAGVICVLLSNGLVNIINSDKRTKQGSNYAKQDYEHNDSMDDSTKQKSIFDSNGVSKGTENDGEESGKKEVYSQLDSYSMTDYEKYYGNKLEAFLSQLYGAGRVRVLVYMKNSKELVLAKNYPYSRKTQEEKDGEETKSVLELENDESVVLYEKENGEQAPLILKEMAPQIGGIVVLAQGGDKKSVVDNISCLLQALFGIDEHKIRVAKLSE